METTDDFSVFSSRGIGIDVGKPMTWTSTGAPPGPQDAGSWQMKVSLGIAWLNM